MVLHPTGLKGRILAVVAEHEQPRPLRVMDHVLSQDVDIGGVAGSHRPRRLTVATGAAAEGVTRQATGQHPRPILFLAHGVKAHAGPRSSAVQAAVTRLRMCCAAVSAQVDGRGPALENSCAPTLLALAHAPATVFVLRVVLVAADEPVEKDDPPSA